MRNTFAIITYFAALSLAPHFALAGAADLERASTTSTGTCYNVANADVRAYCLARSKREPGLCYNIYDSSLRSACLAEVRR